LHEVIFDLARYGKLGYDAVYSMPVHYRHLYVKKLSKDNDKEKARMEKEQGKMSGSPNDFARGPSIQKR
jgi:hypothetical protein